MFILTVGWDTTSLDWLKLLLFASTLLFSLVKTNSLELFLPNNAWEILLATSFALLTIVLTAEAGLFIKLQRSKIPRTGVLPLISFASKLEDKFISIFSSFKEG